MNDMPKDYPRYITPDSEPFDPVELIKRTEALVCKNDARKYTSFYATGVYGGIATGYTVGCCLRCIFCWVDWSRDFPVEHGEFYSAHEAFENLRDTAHKFKVHKLRISGAEPTLGKKHLLGLLEHVESSEFKLFILETNGIYFGIDQEYVRALSKFAKPHIRVGLKAGTPEGFQERTGASRDYFELPYQGISNLLDAGVSFHVASMSADPRFMGKAERKKLIVKLSEIEPQLALNLEEEVVDHYNTTVKRLRYAGYNVKTKR
ncbi:MAG: radical SAM protein [Thermoplasmata archaeon]|nr:radical SAM protein [Thermoplasmata archaeon]